MLDWLFRDRRTGRIVVAQFPNPALWAYLACAVALRLVDPAGTVRTVLVVGRTLALVGWALDEILRGVNPWRRILGTVVLAGTLVGLVVG